MFEDIQKRLSSAFGRFRARGLLTEANIKDGLREVRRVLLEADVSFQLTGEFLARVEKRTCSLNPPSRCHRAVAARAGTSRPSCARGSRSTSPSRPRAGGPPRDARADGA